MIIDFHAHAFPDSIAEKAIQKLAATSGITPCHNGTVTGLCHAMREGDVDLSVVLPVVTAPRQFESINRFSAEHDGKNGLIFFGGIHPENEQLEKLLDELKAAGRRGIKLHPDYQGVYLSDPRYVRILRHCADIGLIAVIHVGYDPYSPNDIHASVDEIERMLEAVYRGGTPSHTTMVLAHLGGNKQFDEAERRLCGAPVYFDTAYTLDIAPPDQVVRICRKHGTDKILFGTDAPWGAPKSFVPYFDTLPFTEEEREQILWKNAASLLGL